jgi:hypothetical protein
MRDMDESFYDDPHEFMFEPTLSRGAEELDALHQLVDALAEYRRVHVPARGDPTWNQLWLAVGHVVANRSGATLDRYELATELGDTDSAAAARRRAETIHALHTRLLLM